MANITLAVPEELKEQMDEHREINWSEVAREAFRQKLEDLEFLREFKSESELTDEEAAELGRKLNKRLAKHYQ